MSFSVGTHITNVHLDNLRNAKFIQAMYDNVYQAQTAEKRAEGWDGYIHCSRLNWNRPADSQVNSLVKYNPYHDGYSRAGDLYHNDINLVIDANLGPSPYTEYKFRIDNWLLQGTMDRVQFNVPGLGNILFEYKTAQDLMRDKAGADRIWKKLFKNKNEFVYNKDGYDFHLSDVLTSSAVFNEVLNEMIVRMGSKEKLIAPEQNHMTQMFTYGWVLKEFFGVHIDWYVLAYATRDSYKIFDTGYHYQHPDTIKYLEKAELNIRKVNACLMDWYSQQQQSNGYNMQSSL